MTSCRATDAFSFCTPSWPDLQDAQRRRRTGPNFLGGPTWMSATIRFGLPSLANERCQLSSLSALTVAEKAPVARARDAGTARGFPCGVTTACGVSVAERLC